MLRISNYSYIVMRQSWINIKFSPLDRPLSPIEGGALGNGFASDHAHLLLQEACQGGWGAIGSNEQTQAVWQKHVTFHHLSNVCFTFNDNIKKERNVSCWKVWKQLQKRSNLKVGDVLSFFCEMVLFSSHLYWLTIVTFFLIFLSAFDLSKSPLEKRIAFFFLGLFRFFSGKILENILYIHIRCVCSL